eukprot:1194387-Prorocentrum_minimum.AAC.1
MPAGAAPNVAQEFTRLETEPKFDKVVIYDCKPGFTVASGQIPQLLTSGTVQFNPEICNWVAVADLSGSLTDYDNPLDYTFASSSPYGFVVHFRSDYSVTSTGWELTFDPMHTGKMYESVDAAIADTDAYRRFSGNSNDDSDGSDTIHDHLLASHGNLTRYAPNTDRWWAILLDTGSSPGRLNFTRFHTERFHDLVDVYSHSAATSVTSHIATFQGSARPGEYAVQVPHDTLLLLHFTSDASVEFTGFEAQYGLGSDFCNTRTNLLSSAAGNLSSIIRDHRNRYRRGLECSWLIDNRGSGGQGLRLTLQQAALYPGDVVSVYSGTSAEEGTLMFELSNGTAGTSLVGINLCTDWVYVTFRSEFCDCFSDDINYGRLIPIYTWDYNWGYSFTWSPLYPDWGFHAHVLPDSNACINPAPPLAWTCSPEFYAAQDGQCDCNCGTYDPDCDATGATVRGCESFVTDQLAISPDEIKATLSPTCIPETGTCGFEVPSDWQCDPILYGTDDGCDCECGAYDPDCSKLQFASAGGRLHGCNGMCESTCAGRSCDDWKRSGYKCRDLELLYGCDCSGCDCTNADGMLHLTTNSISVSCYYWAFISEDICLL